MKVLITGTAGFVGFHLTKRLVEEGNDVLGLDNINNYYDPALKYARLSELGIKKENISYSNITVSDKYKNLRFIKLNLEDKQSMMDLFKHENIEYILHMAAQAGVRYSLENPYAYIESNISGFLNILEGCRNNKVRHLIYASSSSVYGLNQTMPFSVSHNVDHPVSLYAATKKSNELMAHTYSYLYKIPVTGLRFFTVYGPWGRPDMAYYSFTKKIKNGEQIEIFNNGNMKRDFTYIDDIVEGIVKLIDYIPSSDTNWVGTKPDPASSICQYRLYNIGNNKPVDLMEFVSIIEKLVGKEANKIMKPMQPGDIKETFADIDDLQRDIGFKPSIQLKEGLKIFVDWYNSYHR